jgi:tRNA 2-(methylsulfanyl)-N6-isopentenyladenosine37 hydroxylase
MLQPIREFLLCATPDAWVAQALKEPEVLLIDHANCEKKAASTALNLIYRYVDNFELLNKMSRLAREELRHFEQVLAIMQKRRIPYRPVSASRYAAELRKPVRTSEPEKLIDTLIVGAIIEARSCERFACLAPHLDNELKKFYESLLQSEARHFQDYLSLARKAAGAEPIDERVRFFLELERKLIEEADEEFRFHSGVYGEFNSN